LTVTRSRFEDVNVGIFTNYAGSSDFYIADNSFFGRDDAKHLLWMCCALVNVSFPIEVWRQQRVPDSGASDIYPILEPAV